MIWLAVLVLCAVALAPLAWVSRGRVAAKGRRESALALHRAQLAEVDRDLAEGRIGPAEHASAVLEVQRRLLAAGDAPEEVATRDAARGTPGDAVPAAAAGVASASGADRASRASILAALVIVPVAAVGLYLLGGSPGLSSMPLAERRAVAQQRAAEATALAERLREGLARLDPRSEQARQGQVLLGGLEQARGNDAGAAAAWRAALRVRFDATLAVQTAEALARAEGRIGEESVALFRRALETGPPDAPWRPFVERRLEEAAQGR